jgi:LacI family transcriptional regulator, galactose operon repressor
MTKLLEELKDKNEETVASYSMLDPHLVVRESTVRHNAPAEADPAPSDKDTKQGGKPDTPRRKAASRAPTTE